MTAMAARIFWVLFVARATGGEATPLALAEVIRLIVEELLRIYKSLLPETGSPEQN